MKRRGLSITIVLIAFLVSIIISCEKEEEVPNQLPTCKITFPADSLEFDRGDTLTISVVATDSDGSIKEVQFSVDGIGKFSDSSFPYRYDWPTEDETIGSHTIKAISLDSDGGSSSDEIIIQIIEPIILTNPPELTITNPSSSNIIAYPGKYLELALNAKSDLTNGVSLNSIEVIRQFENGANETILNESLSGNNYLLEDLIIQIEDQQGIETWTITVSDNVGKSTIEMITISIQGDAPDLSPVIIFAGGTHPSSGLPYQNTNFTININSQFAIGILANSNSESQAELKQLIVTKAIGTTNPVTILDTTFSGSQFIWDNTYFSSYQPAVETYTFKIIDINEQSEEISLTASTQQADLGIFVFEEKHLGSYQSSVNSGFSTLTGDTYDVNIIPVEQEEEVDFVFFHDAGFGLSLMSPEHNYLIGMYPAINNWETRNKTLFQKTILTNEHYNNIENKNQLILTLQNSAGIGPYVVNYYSSIVSQPGGFEVNDIFAFENPDGNRGIMLIKAIDEGATPGETKIIFDMKVEKP